MLIISSEVTTTQFQALTSRSDSSLTKPTRVFCGIRPREHTRIAMRQTRRHLKPTTLATRSNGWISTANGETTRSREDQNYSDKRSTPEVPTDQSSRISSATRCVQAARALSYLSKPGMPSQQEVLLLLLLRQRPRQRDTLADKASFMSPG